MTDHLPIKCPPPKKKTPIETLLTLSRHKCLQTIKFFKKEQELVKKTFWQGHISHNSQIIFGLLFLILVLACLIVFAILPFLHSRVHACATIPGPLSEGGSGLTVSVPLFPTDPSSVVIVSRSCH